MAPRRGGLIAFLLLASFGAGWTLASRPQLLQRAKHRLLGRPAPSPRLSSGDFPAGAAAPVGEIASVPLRPTRLGFTPRGSSAALLLAAGAPGGERGPGLLRTAYALDAQAVPFLKEEELREALSLGGDHGGVDAAALSVDRLAEWAVSLRDASPRTLLLLGRSRGQEAIAAVGVESAAELRGKRFGVYPHGSARYFALWTLSRAGLSTAEVTWVELGSTSEAGAALREGRADAVAGYAGDVTPAARDRGGKLLASTADAPHLIATVLVARREFLARYPDAVRRALRGLLDAGTVVARDPTGPARLLGEVAPHLGDPVEAVKSAPPSSLRDNLAFFGLSGEAPVTYDELFTSASELWLKLGRSGGSVRAEDSRDLGPLKYVAEARGP
ncbi:MAG: ABC transporter substrate-binding protein [Myxococcales bacterium]|nr:ABC transporter substrate-binding protein [Myxococcales bacterium]